MLNTCHHNIRGMPTFIKRLRGSEHDSGVRSTHMLLVADPQILDAHSYPGRNPWLVWLSQQIVDLNMRKSWRAAQALRPDVVVFLGDMMDNGRMSYAAVEYVCLSIIITCSG